MCPFFFCQGELRMLISEKIGHIFIYLFVPQHDYMKEEEGLSEDEATESKKNLKFGERVRRLSQGS